MSRVKCFRVDVKVEKSTRQIQVERKTKNCFDEKETCD